MTIGVGDGLGPDRGRIPACFFSGHCTMKSSKGTFTALPELNVTRYSKTPSTLYLTLTELGSPEGIPFSRASNQQSGSSGSKILITGTPSSSRPVSAALL